MLRAMAQRVLSQEGRNKTGATKGAHRKAPITGARQMAFNRTRSTESAQQKTLDRRRSKKKTLGRRRAILFTRRHGERQPCVATMMSSCKIIIRSGSFSTILVVNFS
ncbi:hypothetical protein RA307_16780 [Xanthobacteraceae bacterium Astr-EGSB]|uniref:hypothetical protein n=1 Tax=Astrobacterium formosum TaxID=3069710 RepID=UPI0027B0F5E9|nr:hypothetical protein [Xanthobacteraceae bacterium Astr-EGSB]